jgi:hypothetical protein
MGFYKMNKLTKNYIYSDNQREEELYLLRKLKIKKMRELQAELNEINAELAELIEKRTDKNE